MQRNDKTKLDDVVLPLYMQGAWEMQLFNVQLIKADVWPFDFSTPVHLAGFEWLMESLGGVQIDDNFLKMKSFTAACCFAEALTSAQGYLQADLASFSSSLVVLPFCPICRTVGLLVLAESSAAAPSNADQD